MPDGLYERDALAWAERQADLLRRLAAGERVNEEVDWPNVIEEVQDVGRSALRSCRSLLRHAMVHLLKLHAWPGSQAASHWREEAENFINDAEDCFAPSMRQHINLDDLYRRTLKQLRSAADDSGAPGPAPAACPFVLDDFLFLDADVPALLQKLGSASHF